MEAYQLLEVELAKWIGCEPPQVVVCSSGTAALHLALESLRLPEGAHVVTSDFNMVAVPRAIKLAGMEPVFVDCNEQLLMSVEATEQCRIRTQGWSAYEPHGLIATHIYGRCCDMDALVRIADVLSDSHYFRIIEDLAEAHGIRPHRASDAACWSFYRNKVVAGEEGGAVYFKDADHAALARQLRSLGFTDAHDFNHIARGHNYRLANCLAELARDSLEQFSENVAARRRLESAYDALCPDAWRMPQRAAPWVYDLRLPGMTSGQQSGLVNALQAAGIHARHAFKPMTLQEEFCNCRNIGSKNAHAASREVIYLPLTPALPLSTAPLAFSTIRQFLSV